MEIVKVNVSANIEDLSICVSKINNIQSIQSNVIKAVELAKLVLDLENYIDAEFIDTLMALQGKKVGFLTDKDKKKVGHEYVKGDGYDKEIVKQCALDALLNGFQPIGNQFNIIGSQMYPTREGFEYQLNLISNLKYDFVADEINESHNKTSRLKCKIFYTFNGIKEEKSFDLFVKADAYTGVDAIIGKGKRKAYCWLFNKMVYISLCTNLWQAYTQ